MRESIRYKTVSCNLDKCKARVTTDGDWFAFWDMLRKWGWRQALSTSPHPQPSGVVAWGITLHFCPDHSHLADKPEAYTIGPGKGLRPDYTVKLTTDWCVLCGHHVGAHKEDGCWPTSLGCPCKGFNNPGNKEEKS